MTPLTTAIPLARKVTPAKCGSRVTPFSTQRPPVFTQLPVIRARSARPGRKAKACEPLPVKTPRKKPPIAWATPLIPVQVNLAPALMSLSSGRPLVVGAIMPRPDRKRSSALALPWEKSTAVFTKIARLTPMAISAIGPPKISAGRISAIASHWKASQKRSQSETGCLIPRAALLRAEPAVRPASSWAVPAWRAVLASSVRRVSSWARPRPWESALSARHCWSRTTPA